MVCIVCMFLYETMYMLLKVKLTMMEKVLETFTEVIAAMPHCTYTQLQVKFMNSNPQRIITRLPVTSTENLNVLATSLFWISLTTLIVSFSDATGSCSRQKTSSVTTIRYLLSIKHTKDKLATSW